MQAARPPAGPDATSAAHLSVAPGLVLLPALTTAAAAFASREVLLVVVCVWLVAAFVDLRALLGPRAGLPSISAGSSAVAACAFAAYLRRPASVAWVVVALLLVLLTLRILLLESGVEGSEGATSDVASTAAAASAVGVCGCHVLLIAALPRGARAVAALTLVSLSAGLVRSAARAVESRRRLDRTPLSLWSGLVPGIMAGALTGAVARPGSSVVLGGLVGAVTGCVCCLAAASAAGLDPRRQASPILSAVAGGVIAAPVFFWVLRLQ
ncbi:MAG TPA: hypothetical protein VNE62_05050 [Actinomycetota bacterium]|nr:hypothetical protein [Actinomycetota bacterium]